MTRALLSQINLSAAWLVATPTLAALDGRVTLIVTLALGCAAGVMLLSAVIASESFALLVLRLSASFATARRRALVAERRLMATDGADAGEARRNARNNRRLKRAFAAARQRLTRAERDLKATQDALRIRTDALAQAQAAAALWRQMYERELAKHSDAAPPGKDLSNTP